MGRNLFISVCAVASVALLFLVSTQGPATKNEIEYKQFCDVIEATRKTYLDIYDTQNFAARDTQLNEVYKYRMSFLSDIYEGGKFSRWPVRYKTSSILEEHDLLKIELSFDCNVGLVSYLRVTSPLAKDISELKPEQDIVITGSFRIDNESGYFKMLDSDRHQMMNTPKFVMDIKDFSE